MSRREPMPDCASTLCSFGASGSGRNTRFGGAAGSSAGGSTSNSPDNTCANTSPTSAGITGGPLASIAAGSSPSPSGRFASGAESDPKATASSVLGPRRRWRRPLRSGSLPLTSSAADAISAPSAPSGWDGASVAAGSADASTASVTTTSATAGAASEAPGSEGAATFTARLRRTGLSTASGVCSGTSAGLGSRSLSAAWSGLGFIRTFHGYGIRRWVR